MANQYVNKVVYGNRTLIDLTADTVTPSSLLVGYVAHDKSGSSIIGVAVGEGYTITITTEDSDLYGQTITISKNGSIIGTTVFDSSGNASYGVSETGTYTVSVTYDGQTYTESVVVNEITANFATWNATINLSTISLQGETINVTSTGVSRTIAFDNEGYAQFIAHQTGVYTFTVTHEGHAYSTSVNVTAETTYSATINTFVATLNITCDTSILNNSTITIKKGSTTVGTVTMTNAAATFIVYESGSYTASGAYSGITFTSSAVSVTQSISYSVQIKCIPTGSSVTPVNDIQTWLHCANIWNKNYTTLAQVLADTSTLNSLIQSNNAADYMARSTDWATNTCANQTAMTYIGASNYCANKLLGNSTWANAICNSAYFESVLNVKVPTMTSNTTPSGQTAWNIESEDAQHPAYMAFDSDDTNFTYTATVSSRTADLTYTFPSAVTVRKFTIRPYNSSVYTDMTVKIGYSDGGAFTYGSESVKTIANQYSTLNVANYGSHRYWCIHIDDSTASGVTNKATIRAQLYGRA